MYTICSEERMALMVKRLTTVRAAVDIRLGDFAYTTPLQVHGFTTHCFLYCEIGDAGLNCHNEPSQLAVADERISIEITGKTIYFYMKLLSTNLLPLNNST
ncbi:hypothetical protein DPMN_190620 [Dreissena polymorpha]|uniref:Uncharacterized protein n=1 Tax=Dreissena polymorpha TaxID=45954 RepID=A0A9D3Y1C7_DREPO|nr:hypothetical protein DPMN_190620 [Dreissena polymorpha]